MFVKKIFPLFTSSVKLNLSKQLNHTGPTQTVAPLVVHRGGAW